MAAANKSDESSSTTAQTSSIDATEAIMSIPLSEFVRSYLALHPENPISEKLRSMLSSNPEKIAVAQDQSVINAERLLQALAKQEEVRSVASESVIHHLIAQTLAPTFAVWGYSSIIFLVVGTFVFSFTGEPLTLLIIGGVCFSLGLLGSYLTIGTELRRSKDPNPASSLSQSDR